MSLPLVVVLGATGAQGGSVARAVVESKKWRVRGVTRDVNSKKAQELAKLGVEMVQGNANNRDDITKAFSGATAVFSVTNFWDGEAFKSGNNGQYELTQGTLLADVAKAAGVQHFVWSSLPDVEKITGGKLHVPHFTYKHKVEEHIKAIGLPATFVYASCYVENYTNFFLPKWAADGVPEFYLPLKPETEVPVFSAENDLGAVVRAVLENKQQHLNEVIFVAAEYISFPKMMEIYTKVTGKPARFVSIDYDTYRKSGALEDLVNMWNYYNDYPFFPGANMEPAKKLNPNMTTWEAYLRKTGFTWKQ